MWAKISTSATSMACAACLVAAATLPAVEKAGSGLTETAGVNLAVDFSRLAAFDAIPFLLALDPSGLDSLNAITTFFGPDGVFGAGGVDALLPSDTSPGYAALSALPVFVGPNSVFGAGGVDALANYDALSAIPAVLAGDLSSLDSLSAIPPYIALAGGDIDATGDLDSVSAIRTFFGSDGVFGTGGIDALLPNAETGHPGYAALSALPVFVGPNSVFGAGGVEALANYDALSAIPAYLAPAPAAATALVRRPRARRPCLRRRPRPQGPGR